MEVKEMFRYIQNEHTLRSCVIATIIINVGTRWTSVNIHILAFLPLGKGPQLSIEWESGEGVRSVWTLLGRHCL